MRSRPGGPSNAAACRTSARSGLVPAVAWLFGGPRCPLNLSLLHLLSHSGCGVPSPSHVFPSAFEDIMRSLYEIFWFGPSCSWIADLATHYPARKCPGVRFRRRKRIAVPARRWWEFPNLSAGAATSAPTETAEARFAALTATCGPPTLAAAEPTTSNPDVLLGSVPSRPWPQLLSDLPPPLRRLLPYVGAATSLLQHKCSTSWPPMRAGAFERPVESVRRSRFRVDRPDRDHGSLRQR